MESTHDAANTAISSMALLTVLGIALAIYVFYCYCLKLICEKAGHDPGILIWIPILQIVPMLQVAGMATWMILLFFIPLVNLIVMVMMWANVCSARGKSPWLVIMVFIPFLNLIFIPYLAFSD